MERENRISNHRTRKEWSFSKKLAEGDGTCWRRNAVVLIGALKKIDADHMILITSLTEGLREGSG
jgi:hypothetical protein